MTNEIETVKINGSTVYGVDQMAYSVNGVKDLNLGDAIFHVSTIRAAALEEDAAVFSRAIKLRQQKLEDLGKAMALISQQIAEAGKKMTDKVDANKYGYMTICNRYGISRSVGTKGQLMSLQTDVQYAMDKEDNDLQQDMVSLQSLFSKRDQAFSTASSMMKKFDKGLADTIRQIGG